MDVFLRNRLGKPIYTRLPSYVRIMLILSKLKQNNDKDYDLIRDYPENKMIHTQLRFLMQSGYVQCQKAHGKRRYKITGKGFDYLKTVIAHWELYQTELSDILENRYEKKSTYKFKMHDYILSPRTNDIIMLHYLNQANRPQSMKDLRQCRLHTDSVSIVDEERVVLRLLQQGYVIREQKDGERRYYYSNTPAGQQRLKQLVEEWEKERKTINNAIREG